MILDADFKAQLASLAAPCYTFLRLAKTHILCSASITMVSSITALMDGA